MITKIILTTLSLTNICLMGMTPEEYIQKFDLDKNGKLSAEELLTYYDANSDGKLSQAERSRAILDYRILQRDQARRESLAYAADKAKKQHLTLFEENFNAESEFSQRLLAGPYVELAKNKGRDRSNAIKVSYVGARSGSKHVIVHYPLKRKVMSVTLSFDVMFDKDFQWVMGGKLHGVGPKRIIAGGLDRTPGGWSGRMMFHSDGRLGPYIYDQHRGFKYGRSQPSREPVLKRNKWHRVVFELTLNDPGKRNGSVRVSVDNKEVSSIRKMQFRKVETDASLITTFMFNTFHGGGSESWAPKDKDGKFTTVYAYYDNFLILENPSK